MNQIVIITGWVKTGMIDKPIEEIGSRLHLKGRIILPEEIANAIWLMSLPKASAINGTTVMADDGYSSFKGVDGFQAESKTPLQAAGSLTLAAVAKYPCKYNIDITSIVNLSYKTYLSFCTIASPCKNICSFPILSLVLITISNSCDPLSLTPQHLHSFFPSNYFIFINRIPHCSITN